MYGRQISSSFRIPLLNPVSCRDEEVVVQAPPLFACPKSRLLSGIAFFDNSIFLSEDSVRES